MQQSLSLIYCLLLHIEHLANEYMQAINYAI